jgi:hypothetical protein
MLHTGKVSLIVNFCITSSQSKLLQLFPSHFLYVSGGIELIMMLLIYTNNQIATFCSAINRDLIFALETGGDIRPDYRRTHCSAWMTSLHDLLMENLPVRQFVIQLEQTCQHFQRLPPLSVSVAADLSHKPLDNYY